MQNPISRIWPQLQSRLKGRLPKGLAGAVFWIAIWFCLLLLLRDLPGAWGSFFRILQFFVGLALVSVTIPWLWHLVRTRMLWSLRNKLVLTYLLIGLAPVILFVTLAAISAYIAAGQFSIHLADSRLQAELTQMAGENGRRADVVAQMLDGQLPLTAIHDIEQTDTLDSPRLKLRREIGAFVDGAPLPLGSAFLGPSSLARSNLATADSGQSNAGQRGLGSAAPSSAVQNSATQTSSMRGRTPLGLPPWATRLKTGEFNDLVSDGGDLYLVAIHQHRLKNGQMLSLVTSLPVGPPLMNMIASGLGLTRLQPTNTEIASNRNNIKGEPKEARGVVVSEKPWITGGTEPQRGNVADIGVIFTSTEPMTDWATGERGNILIAVNSRPSLLYYQLFGASLGGIVTSVIRIALVLLCVVFALIELLALVMAIRLSRTITASVADLYQATLQIDRGELDHQIVVKRDDQLAGLSLSFNRMTKSLQRLLLEQKEKERLQNELSIAQEVQANLFPHRVHNMQTLELHGVCRPARSVSGDYYDFLVFHKNGHNGQASPAETGVAIAIGDISGKGISAALLMATLHSAVRAYRFASEELVYSESSVAGLTASKEVLGGDHDELFESPGRILSLLNRHLYRSTQPEKYATLFLAHYDVASSVLTYSNAGQLPPLVLGRDGSIRRLDQGGTVVGLMDGMKYDEGRVQMQPGDILVAYSDGVTEPENDFGEFGEERLMEVVSRYRDQPLHVISTQVMQALDAWIGADEQPDDITLVLARQA
jgi:sigma-B regulation protein RsbU (phosphoserine phosphatase)